MDKERLFFIEKLVKMPYTFPKKYDIKNRRGGRL